MLKLERILFRRGVNKKNVGLIGFNWKLSLIF